MTRYLVTGAGGMLGADLSRALEGRDATLLARADLDISDAAAVDAAVAGHDVVINAAAYTKVDDAESDEDAATLINGTAAGILAEAAARHGARIVQVSTDYVFDGTATSPYREDAPRHPVSAYGRSKALGEELVERAHPDGHYIVRTAWLYGADGPNFAKTMLRLAADRDTIGVVTDQVGQPTWTGDLARQIVALLDSDAPAGVYHGTNSGEASWFDFARAVLESQGLDPERITPTDSSAFVRPAPRPAYSVLGHDRWAAAGLPPLRPWREALDAAAASGALRLP
ncbi:dTDP-4-dehydrorhamnose reductase [Antiquaquibacter soli]|uniref:dTDP-4-dehydrorhamnose reductase n=1 Tax=Antiquaquibacter soli TaxID=3064523 RepID=A0ABT9BJC0_9MICO|nr:dTDP-4-dehydrorhamnose reductase [Protaetiibacter sp. WY-16]MDO7881113.1 dTDP-4-dehydrorhamnose reductase [Protaetiibacter sp. WY-16]